MKVVRLSFCVIVGILLFLVLLFTSIEGVSFNRGYYHWQYERHSIPSATHLDMSELMKVTNDMLQYLRGSRKTLDMTAVIDGIEQEVFGEREKSHMVDVKKLFIVGTYIKNISLFFLVLAFGYMIWKNKKLLLQAFSTIKYVFAAIIMLILILSGLLLSNFNKYWTIFHEIFFTNDLWLLNPKTDILINMVPEIFFFQTAMIILGIFVVGTVLLLTLIEMFKKKLQRA